MSPVDALVADYPLLELLIGLVILTVVILAHGIGVRLVYRHFARTWEESSRTRSA